MLDVRLMISKTKIPNLRLELLLLK